MRSPPAAPPPLQVVLIKIDQFSDFKEVRAELRNAPGVTRVIPRSESAGLITLEVVGNVNPDALAQILRENLGKKYTVTQKTLPSGAIEINVAKGS